MIPIVAENRRVRLRSLLVTACFLLAACGGAEAQGGKPQVVAGFYPLQYLAERVAGGHADVASLATPGAEPHDLELSIRQRAAVADADLVIYDAAVQPAVADAVEQSGQTRSLESGRLVSSVSEDPHFWLDTTSMQRVGRHLRDQMSQLDPAHEADYRANFARLSDDLDRLAGDYEQGLRGCALDTVVVSHDAFGALERYGLRFAAINGLTPDAEPSPGHLAQLQDLIEAEGVDTVFSETLASPELARALAEDLSVRTAVLDPIEGLSEATADEDYLSLMRRNLAALREANRCR